MKLLLKSVKIFNGEGDVNKWLERAKAIAETASEDICKAMPMLLDGKAYDVYSNLEKYKKLDINEIEVALKNAFDKSKVETFRMIKERKWNGEESSQSLLTDIKTMYRVIGQECDVACKLFFICSLPNNVQEKIETMIDYESENLDTIAAKADIFLRENKMNISYMAKSSNTFEINQRSSGRDGRSSWRNYPQEISQKSHDGVDMAVEGRHQKAFLPKCYFCGKIGHIVRYCEEKRKHESKNGI